MQLWDWPEGGLDTPAFCQDTVGNSSAAQQLARLCEKSGRWGPVP